MAVARVQELPYALCRVGCGHGGGGRKASSAGASQVEDNERASSRGRARRAGEFGLVSVQMAAESYVGHQSCMCKCAVVLASRLGRYPCSVQR